MYGLFERFVAAMQGPAATDGELAVMLETAVEVRCKALIDEALENAAFPDITFTVVDSPKEDRSDPLWQAVRQLYYAGRWTCNTLTMGDQDKLWQNVRDQAGFIPGNSQKVDPPADVQIRQIRREAQERIDRMMREAIRCGPPADAVKPSGDKWFDPDELGPTPVDGHIRGDQLKQLLKNFWRGCGVPEDQYRSLTEWPQADRFYLVCKLTVDTTPEELC